MIEAHLLTAGGLKKPIRQMGERLVIDRNSMQIWDDEVAVHTRHSWLLGDQKFLVMKINSRTVVRLERGSEQSELHGPFNQLWIVDGMILYDLEQREPLVQFDYDTTEWVHPVSELRWERIIFEKQA